jgi:hypothetical protein
MAAYLSTAKALGVLLMETEHRMIILCDKYRLLLPVGLASH